jgi:hypothetical protein
VTIGNTGKSVDGSANVSWSLAEIGALPLAGGTLSGALTAPNFSDATGSYNINLGSGGSEGRGLVAGYSGGSYGGIGYNVRHTTTGGQWTAPSGDTSTYLLFNSGGFTFYGAGSGAGGRTLSFSTLASLNSSGVFNTLGAITQNGNQVLHAGNFTNYAPGSGSNWTFGEVYSNGWFRNNNSGQGLYNQATANHFYSDGAYWNVAYSGTQGIRFRNGHGGTILGYLYAETNGNFGLLHNGGGWAVQVSPGGGGNLAGTWTIGSSTPLTAANYTNYTNPSVNLPYVNGEYNGAVNSDGWYTIAEYGSGRAQATFHIFDEDSSRHNYTRVNVVWSFGQGAAYVTSAGRHGSSTIRHVRLLYNTSDQTYGGVKVQVYCESASWTLRIRQETLGISGWGSFTQVTPTLANTVSSFAEYSRTSNVNDNGWLSIPNGLYIGTNITLHAGNYTSYTGGLSTFNTWTNTNYFRSNIGPTSGSVTNPPLQAFATGNNAAFMSFHRESLYAVNMGLDSDNVFRIGGWSASANRLQMDMSGNLTMAGNVTAYSDERLKKDWASLPENFVERLAKVKNGTYTRTDEDMRQVGVSAQSLQPLLPEAVLEGEHLSVAYGNAALAACVELAKELVKLKQEILELKAQKNV